MVSFLGAASHHIASKNITDLNDFKTRLIEMQPILSDIISNLCPVIWLNQFPLVELPFYMHGDRKRIDVTTDHLEHYNKAVRNLLR